eukprot:CAMPEP_0117073790 /NCGR_PEP_ID=MMETSP0472-20121206/51954_1 /TAXON_ID=693140 ORGANISM="Tiarina fusus, Strain LIS" /NCGR_SAMPLE_ID=MMETSP0472 /ASSEMBLY_ACC=CAM_ASM_000603 /LENGTH=32 /DNA_ID= /DNA_START= /DNA_END= /DNA_ORIENTATION=
MALQFAPMVVTVVFVHRFQNVLAKPNATSTSK